MSQVIQTMKKTYQIDDFIQLFKQLNKIAIKMRTADMKIDWKEEGGRRSPVTEADIIINNMLCEYVREYSESFENPEEFLIISEELKELSYEERDLKKYSAIWVIDPLDGTKSYISYDSEKGVFTDDGFTINLARLELQPVYVTSTDEVSYEWTPVMGIVSKPTSDMIFWGIKGVGSFQVNPDNTTNRIGYSPETTVFKSFREIVSKRPVRISVSASHCDDKTLEYIEKYFGDNYETYPSGSSIKLIDVFLGKSDIYPRLGRTMEWDICAATAIGLACGFNIKIYDPNVTRDQFYNMETVKFNKEDLTNPYFIVF
jgi:3'(2'), 5'-bisphosphate nucleotidase